MVQITIDGSKDFHNARRTTPHKDDTYSVIMHNIKTMLSLDRSVLVRVNIDKLNRNGIRLLIDELYELKEDVQNRKAQVKLSFGRVSGSKNDLSHNEFQDIISELDYYAAEKGVSITNLPYNAIARFCNAESMDFNISVDIFGNLYKCWHDIFNRKESFMTLDEFTELIRTGIPPQLINKNGPQRYFIDEQIIENINGGKCLLCEYLPVCRGMCPKERGSEPYKSGKCKEIQRKIVERQLTCFLKHGDAEKDNADMADLI